MHVGRATLFCQERAKAHANLNRKSCCQESQFKLGHHRSTVNVRTGKTGTDSARTRRTGTGAGKGRATARVKPRLSLPLPRTRDGHAATYSAMREHACYNCTTCFTQVRSGGLSRMLYTPPAKARRLVLSTAELARSSGFCTHRALGRHQFCKKGRGVKNKEGKGELLAIRTGKTSTDRSSPKPW